MSISFFHFKTPSHFFLDYLKKKASPLSFFHSENPPLLPAFCSFSKQHQQHTSPLFPLLSTQMAVRQAVYKDTWTAAFYGNNDMLKKLIEVTVNEEGETVPTPEDLSPAAREAALASYYDKVNTPGVLTTYSASKTATRFGFGFTITAANKQATSFAQSYNTAENATTPAPPLFWAVLGNESDTVLYLLRLGALTNVAVTKFQASPLDVAKANSLLSMQNLLQSEEVVLLHKIETVAAELKQDLEQIFSKTSATDKTGVEVSQEYYQNSASFDTLFASDGASERDPPMSQTSLPLLSSEEGEAAFTHATTALTDPSLALRELGAAVKCSPGRLSLLAERLRGRFEDDTGTTSVQLLASFLAFSDSKNVKAMLDPDPESEAEFPNLFQNFFVKPEEEEGTPPPSFHGLELVLRSCAKEVKEPITLFSYLAEPEEAWSESIKKAEVGGQYVTSRSIPCQGNAVKEKAEEAKSGILVEYVNPAAVFFSASYSRFPAEDLAVLPAFTPLEVLEVVAATEEVPLTTVRLACKTSLLAPAPDTIFFLNKVLAEVKAWHEVKNTLRNLTQQAHLIAHPPPPEPEAEEENGEAGEGEEEAQE